MCPTLWIPLVYRDPTPNLCFPELKAGALQFHFTLCPFPFLVPLMGLCCAPLQRLKQQTFLTIYAYTNPHYETRIATPPFRGSEMDFASLSRTQHMPLDERVVTSFTANFFSWERREAFFRSRLYNDFRPQSPWSLLSFFFSGIFIVGRKVVLLRSPPLILPFSVFSPRSPPMTIL